MSHPRKAKGLRGQSDCTSRNNHNDNSTGLYESIKAEFLQGRDVCLIHYPPEQRCEAMGAIAQLRDELPIRAGWQTIRESHLSETRLRARRYSIPGEFLRGEK